VFFFDETLQLDYGNNHLEVLLFGSGTDPMPSYLIVVVLFVRATAHKKPKFLSFQIGSG